MIRNALKCETALNFACLNVCRLTLFVFNLSCSSPRQQNGRGSKKNPKKSPNVLPVVTRTYLEDQALLFRTLQREAAQPQVVGAVLGQLAQKTRHAFRRGSRHAHAGAHVELNTLGKTTHKTTKKQQQKPQKPVSD